MAVNVLFFLGEIVRVSFHIDQEFRFGIQDSGDKYTPPYLDGCQNFCGGRNRNLFSRLATRVAGIAGLVAYFRFTFVSDLPYRRQLARRSFSTTERPPPLYHVVA